MAQAGYTPIQLYYSTTASAAPSSGNLANGELAINITDGKLYYKDNGGTVRVLAGTGGTGVVAGSNTQVQFNNNGVFGASSGLTWDGTNLTASQLRSSGLTSGRVTYAGASGLLVDSANLTFDGTTLTMAANPVLSGGTANGVAYLNGSKVLTTGSALTFDGTTFRNTVGGAAFSGVIGAGVSASANGRFRAFNSTNDRFVEIFNDGAVSTINSTFGSAGASPLTFQISDSEQMRLTSTGLGIGTSSPGYKLHSVSSVSSTSAFFETTTTDAYIGIKNPSTAGYIGVLSSGNMVFQTPGSSYATKLTLDNVGNLGLGVTPSAWSGFGKTMEFNNAGCYVGNSGATSMQVGANNYFNGSNYIYSTSNVATRYAQASGQHLWYTAPSGTAGNAISFTQAMTLNASSQLLINTTSGETNSQLFVSATAASSQDKALVLYETVSAKSIRLLRTGATYSYAGMGASEGALYTANNDLNIVADGGAIKFNTGTTVGATSERARISSNGDWLVGTTANAFSSARGEIRGAISQGGQPVFSVYNNDGGSGTDVSPVMAFYKQSSTTSSSARFLQFYAAGNGTPMGGIVGNGASNVQFASISDVREKTNIAPISGSLEKIAALKPVAFDWIASGDHCPAGFVAQDVEQVFPEFVVENMANEGQEARKGLTGGMTGGIIAHLVKAIQEQQAIINQLKARLDAANL